MNKQERRKFCEWIDLFLLNPDRATLINMITELEVNITKLKRKKKELKKNQKYVKRRLIKLLKNATQEYYEDILKILEECIKKLE